MFRSSYTKMPKVAKVPASRPPGARRRPWPADQPDRGGGDRWHEREELEADVNERTQEPRCLLIVEPQPVLGVHGVRGRVSRRGGGQAIEAAAALDLVLSNVRFAFRGRADDGWRDSQGRSRGETRGILP